jgi:hypothetical protein
MVLYFIFLGMIAYPKEFLFKAENSLKEKRKEEIMIQWILILSETAFFLSWRIFHNGNTMVGGAKKCL